MNKVKLKQIRDKMIYDLWEDKKAEWEMNYLCPIFGLEIAQIYRIIKKVGANQNKQ